MNIEQIRQALASGGLVIGSEVNEMRSPAIAEIYAAAGFDYIMIDQEHTAIDLSEVAGIIRVARLSGIAPFVRVPEIDYNVICRPLDQGAQGIVVPRVTSRDQVLEVLDMIRYHPKGRRGLAVGGPSVGYRDINAQEFVDRANNSIMLVVQIESEAAVRDIDSIISVPGVDVAFVGPVDLSLSVGRPCEFTDEKVVSLIQEVVDKCREHRVVSGIALFDLDLIAKWISAGMRFFWVGNEVVMILSQGRQIVQGLREFFCRQCYNTPCYHQRATVSADGSDQQANS
ncbi:MAG: hypothetical protein HPY71_12475 [Firmicutes bacterium]|nr:hypothetical protein [Bacillota bacterium]